jgi:hypothetical protein
MKKPLHREILREIRILLQPNMAGPYYEQEVNTGYKYLINYSQNRTKADIAVIREKLENNFKNCITIRHYNNDALFVIVVHYKKIRSAKINEILE